MADFMNFPTPRERVLTHGDRRFHMVLGEQALHTNVGGAEVMTGQLEHLLAVLRMPRLRLGVIPASAPYRVPLNNGFGFTDAELATLLAASTGDTIDFGNNNLLTFTNISSVSAQLQASDFLHN